MIKIGGEVVGNRTKCKIVKNKVAPPFREAEFDIMYGKGISRVGEVLDMAVDLDIVNKSGAWFTYNDNRLGQGRDNVKEVLENNPELLKEIETKVLENRELAVSSTKKPKVKGRVTAASKPASVSLDAVVDDE